MKRSNQLFERHKCFKQRQQDKVINCCGYNSHDDAGNQTGDYRGFLCFVKFIDKSGYRNKAASHDKVSKFAGTTRRSSW